MNNNILAYKAAIMAFFGAIGSLVGWKGIMVIAWVSLMALDYITGTFAAMKSGEWCSNKAREGVWHKCGAIIVVIVAAIADGIMLVICGNIPVFNITWPGVLLPMILAWYIITELGSILENAVKLGANPPAWLTKILAVSLKAVESAGSHVIENSTDNILNGAANAEEYNRTDILAE